MKMTNITINKTKNIKPEIFLSTEIKKQKKKIRKNFKRGTIEENTEKTEILKPQKTSIKKTNKKTGNCFFLNEQDRNKTFKRCKK
jgi:hypothetical protein